MGRRKTTPLSAAIAQAKRVRQKERLRFGMVYCSNKSCGWGWELREGLKCPQCNSMPSGEDEGVFYCSSEKCGFGWEETEGEVCPKCGALRIGAKKAKKEGKGKEEDSPKEEETKISE